MDDVLTIIADLRAEIAELRRRVDRLESPRSAAQSDDEQDDRPPGVWVSLKQAAFEAGRSEAWLLLQRKCGAVRQWREGGRIVEMGSVRAAIGALDGAERACANSGA
jgi:hypothetical protein